MIHNTIRQESRMVTEQKNWDDCIVVEGYQRDRVDPEPIVVRLQRYSINIEQKRVIFEYKDGSYIEV